MRLAMKPGVSLHRTTVLPSDRSAKRQMSLAAPARMLLPTTTSSNCVNRGGLKKCVIMKSRVKLSGMPAVSVWSGRVDVLDDTIEPGLRCASILR